MLYCNSLDQCRLIFLYKLFITPINKNHIQSIVFLHDWVALTRTVGGDKEERERKRCRWRKGCWVLLLLRFLWESQTHEPRRGWSLSATWHNLNLLVVFVPGYETSSWFPDLSLHTFYLLLRCTDPVPFSLPLFTFCQVILSPCRS